MGRDYPKKLKTNIDDYLPGKKKVDKKEFPKKLGKIEIKSPLGLKSPFDIISESRNLVRKEPFTGMGDVKTAETQGQAESIDGRNVEVENIVNPITSKYITPNVPEFMANFIEGLTSVKKIPPKEAVRTQPEENLHKRKIQTLEKVNSGEIRIPEIIKVQGDEAVLKYLGLEDSGPLNLLTEKAIEIPFALQNLSTVLPINIAKVINPNVDESKLLPEVDKRAGYKKYTPYEMPGYSTGNEVQDFLLKTGPDIAGIILTQGAVAPGIQKVLSNPKLANIISSGLGFTLPGQPRGLSELTAGKITPEQYAEETGTSFVTGGLFGANPYKGFLKRTLYNSFVTTLPGQYASLMKTGEFDVKEYIKSAVTQGLLDAVMHIPGLRQQNKRQIVKENIIEDLTREIEQLPEEQRTVENVITRLDRLLEKAAPAITAKNRLLEMGKPHKWEITPKGDIIEVKKKEAEPMILAKGKFWNDILREDTPFDYERGEIRGQKPEVKSEMLTVPEVKKYELTPAQKEFSARKTAEQKARFREQMVNKVIPMLKDWVQREDTPEKFASRIQRELLNNSERIGKALVDYGFVREYATTLDVYKPFREFYDTFKKTGVQRRPIQEYTDALPEPTAAEIERAKEFVKLKREINLNMNSVETGWKMGSGQIRKGLNDIERGQIHTQEAKLVMDKINSAYKEGIRVNADRNKAIQDIFIKGEDLQKVTDERMGKSPKQTAEEFKKTLINIATTDEGVSAEGIKKARELANESKDLFTTEQIKDINWFIKNLQDELAKKGKVKTFESQEEFENAMRNFSMKYYINDKNIVEDSYRNELKRQGYDRIEIKKPEKTEGVLTLKQIKEKQAELDKIKERSGKTIAELYPEATESAEGTFEDYFKSLQEGKIRAYNNREVAKQDYYLKILSNIYENEIEADNFGTGIRKKIANINEGIMRNAGSRNIKEKDTFDYVNKKITELFKEAKEEGKSIPEEVLKDYPELVKSEKETPRRDTETQSKEGEGDLFAEKREEGEGKEEEKGEVKDLVSKYGWEAKETSEGVHELYNRNGNKAAIVKQTGNEYLITDIYNNKLLKGNDNVGSGVKKLLTEYFYAELKEDKTTNVLDDIEIQRNDIDYQKAVWGYSGTSFSPEIRARDEQTGYVEIMTEFLNKLKVKAKSPEQQQLAYTEFIRYKAEYRGRYNNLLSARTGLMSSMIAGPSNFPAERQRKKNNAYDNKEKEFYEWKSKVENSILKKIEKQGIEDQGGIYEVTKKEIEKLEKLQQIMKGANAVLRKKDLTNEQKTEELIKLGINKIQAKVLLEEPDYGKIYGFRDFELTSNNLKIKRLKEKLAGFEQQDKDIDIGNVTIDKREGIEILKNPSADRIQLLFDEKPSEEIREALKRNGWHWSPREEAWQRKTTQYAVNDALNIADRFFKKQAEEFNINNIPKDITPENLRDLLKTEAEKLTKEDYIDLLGRLQEHVYTSERYDNDFQSAKRKLVFSDMGGSAWDRLNEKSFGEKIDEKYAEAKKRIEERKGKYGLRAQILPNPENIPDYIIIGAKHFKDLYNASADKVVKFVEWSNKMIEEAGEYVKPYLRQIWGEVKKQEEEIISRKDAETQRTKQTEKEDFRFTEKGEISKEKIELNTDDIRELEYRALEYKKEGKSNQYVRDKLGYDFYYEKDPAGEIKSAVFLEAVTPKENYGKGDIPELERQALELKRKHKSNNQIRRLLGHDFTYSRNDITGEYTAAKYWGEVKKTEKELNRYTEIPETEEGIPLKDRNNYAELEEQYYDLARYRKMISKGSAEYADITESMKSIHSKMIDIEAGMNEKYYEYDPEGAVAKRRAGEKQDLISTALEMIPKFEQQAEEKGYKGEDAKEQVKRLLTKELYTNTDFQQLSTRKKAKVLKQLDKFYEEKTKQEFKLINTLDEQYTEPKLRNFFKKSVLQSIKVVEKMGEGGKEIANRLRRMEDHERQLMGEPSKIMLEAEKLTEAELRNLQDIRNSLMFFEEPMNPISENVARVNSMLDNYYYKMAEGFKDRGFITTNPATGEKYLFNPLKRYEPRILDLKLDKLGITRDNQGRAIHDSRRETILQYLVDSNQADNKAEAEAKLQGYIAMQNTRIGRQGNVEFARVLEFPRELYVRDPVTRLIKYATRSAKRLAHADAFGIEGNIASRLLDRVRGEYYDQQFARDLYRYETGQLTVAERKALESVNVLKGLQAVTKFSPFTTLRNAMQGFLGSSTRGNLKAGITGLIKGFTKESRKNAYWSGALADTLENYVGREMGGESKFVSNYLKWIGFTGTDKFNRIISSAAGEVFYKDMLKRIVKDSMLKKRAVREFNKMGLDAEKISKRGHFTEEELNKIRRTFAGDAQFNIRPSDLPLYWSSPVGKLVTQWKSFGYKMTQLINESVIKELKAGNIFPLMTMLGAYTITGEAVNTIIDAVRSVFNFNPRKEDIDSEGFIDKLAYTKLKRGKFGEFALRIVQDLSGLGAMSIAVDIFRSMGYGKSSALDTSLGVTGAVFGPTISTGIGITADVIGPIAWKMFSTEGEWDEVFKRSMRGVYRTAAANIPFGSIPRTLGLTKLMESKIFGVEPSKKVQQYMELKKKGINITKLIEIDSMESEVSKLRKKALKTGDPADAEAYRRADEELDLLKESAAEYQEYLKMQKEEQRKNDEILGKKKKYKVY